MKNKRFWAALLCTAMVLTSQSFNVSAAMQDGLLTPEDAVISAETVEGSESLTDDVDNLTVGTEELSVDEEVLSDKLIIEDELQPVADDVLVEGNEGVSEYEALEIAEDKSESNETATPTDYLTTVSKNGLQYLALKSGYSSLEATGVETVVIPKEADVIPADSTLFKGNKKIISVSFEEGGISSNLVIEKEAFKGSSIKNFYAPENYHTVSENTFEDCTSLVTFDNKNVTSIGDYAFSGCGSFGSAEDARWKKKITYIGENAFSRTGIDVLVLADIVSDNNVYIGRGAFSSCLSLANVTIPANVSLIPESCFEGCSKLNVINIDKSAAGTVVGRYAFKGCTSLESIGLDGFKAETLSANAFEGCTKLARIYLPDTVKTVSANVFSGCNAITWVEFHYHNADWSDTGLTINDTAFPSTVWSKTTLCGYGQYVKDYATSNAHRFKEFKSLLKENDIKAEGVAGKSGFLQGKEFTPSVTKAKANTPITFTLKPREIAGGPWRLRRGSLYDKNNGLTVNDIEFVSGTHESQVFKFKMPYDAVEIAVSPGFYTDAMLDGAEYSVKIAAYEEKGRFEETSTYWYAPHTGYMGQIYIDAKVNKSGGKYNDTYKLGQWMFTYDSADKNIATVSEHGVITAVKPGETTITAIYRTTNKKIQIPIVVGPEKEIDDLKIEPVDMAYNTTNRFIDGENRDVPFIVIDETKLRSDKKEIKIKLLATSKDTGSQTYAVNADWIVGNETKATLKFAKTKDNNNVITIPKGVSGDTYVRASFNTYRKDKDDKNIILYAYLLVKITSTTPRVTVDDIVINTNCDDLGTTTKKATGGVPIKIIAAGNEEISDTAVLDLWVGKDRASARSYDGLILKNKASTLDGNYRLIFNPGGTDLALGMDSSINKSKTYSGNNKLWIRGKYKNAGADDYFWIPLNKVTIENKPLNLAAKVSGKINLWYKHSCYLPIPKNAKDETETNIKFCYDELPRKASETYDADGNLSYIERYTDATVGKVLYTNNIPNETAEVHHVMLWDVDHYKNWKRKETGYTDAGDLPVNVKDKLNTNFEAGLDLRDGTNEIDFKITRRDTELEYNIVNDKKVDVVQGYLAVYFTGYTKPVLQPVTIPTEAKAPSYVMSDSSVTESSKNTKGTFRFKILDSSKKKAMLTQTNVAEYSLDATNGTVFTSVNFDDEDVVLTAVDSRLSGKKTAIINIRKSNWQKSAQYKYTVNYVEKDPVAKLKNSNVKLNRWYPGMPVNTELALNQANCTLTLEKSGGSEFIYSGSDRLALDAKNIRIQATAIYGYINKLAISVDFPDQSKLPAKGTYKYTFTPQYKYAGGTSISLKPMTLNVSVLDNQPTIRFSNNTHIFNMDYPDLENKEVIAAFGNLPAGVELKDINIDVTGAKWTLVKSAKDSGIASTVSSKIRMYPKYDADKKRWCMTFKLEDTGLKNRDFNILYELSDVTINGSKIKPVRITVKGINKEPTVAVSAKGRLNAIDYVTPLQYTVKFSNLTNPKLNPASIAVIGLSDNKVSQFLQAKPDEKNDKLINVTLISGKELPNKDYKFQLKFIITPSNTKLDVYSKSMKVKPVQKTSKIEYRIDWNNPKIKKASFFSGVADNARVMDIDLIKTSELKTYITDIKIKDSNSADIKNAFRVEYHKRDVDLDTAINRYKTTFTKNTKQDPTGYITIKCINPELLKAGKTYNLVLETEYAGQFHKTDKYGNEVKDDKGNPIKINGSTFKIPVVVYD